jgi:hypothetical protein
LLPARFLPVERRDISRLNVADVLQEFLNAEG